MVDIHCHILPGLDDGPETLAESVEMLRVAALAGTTDLVATPHANARYAFDPDRVRQKLRELEEASGGIVRLHSGCDFHLSYENIQNALVDPTRFTINHRRYLLVEFSDAVIFKTTGLIFERLLATGAIPVITHPERNALLAARIDQLREWVEQGSCLQLTAQSLLGRFGKAARRSSERLLEERLVHFVASDAHDAIDRPPALDEARVVVARRYGEDRARQLFDTNPRAALSGEALPHGENAPPAGRGWRRLWRSA